MLFKPHSSRFGFRIWRTIFFLQQL
jgi:hypothetical protein